VKRVGPALVLLAACGAEVVGEPRPQPESPGPVLRGEWRPPAAPEPVVQARFVGPWLVDQPWHALYEASVYEFRADGTLVHVKTWTYGGGPADYRTGTVSDPQWRVRCTFDGAWRSLDAATLVIAGACTDGVARDIVLAFNDDPSANAWDAGARVVSVGGDASWGHFFPEWRWAKCAAIETCRGVEVMP
jgi:hypothetical protein